MDYANSGLPYLMFLSQHYEEDLAKRSLVWNDIEKRHVFVKVEEQKDEAEAS